MMIDMGEGAMDSCFLGQGLQINGIVFLSPREAPRGIDLLTSTLPRCPRGHALPPFTCFRAEERP
jgi:hypothetical protein